MPEQTINHTQLDSLAELLSLKYDEPRHWITRMHQKGRTWNDIAERPTSAPLSEFLKSKEEEEWPEISVEMWKALVSQQEEAELETISIDVRNGHALVVDGSTSNGANLPDNPHSCWRLYKDKLAAKGFAERTIGEIERATLKLLRRLSDDTREMDPVKGLVIGNVQSGKTANMAALMAMAADCGWNMFIVLSGTIENLRIQTQERLLEDLNSEGCSLSWSCLDHPAQNAAGGSRAQDLRFEPGSRSRYFTVALKNASRLKNLIQWLQRDANKQQQMKIIVIDDEADQAGVNTASVDSDEERKKINRLICALVNGQNEKSEDIDIKYRAMNYIGYTATPYANILNESGRESLYPRNFISTLSVSKEYFGPQQIFGIHDGIYDGLDIVRDVSAEDLATIKDIHTGAGNGIPESLADAICWFACGVAAMRLRNYRKPISMLVHTSQKVAHHANISSVIQDWVNTADKDELLERCRDIWESETSQFSLQEFREQYPDYGLIDDVADYPSFDEIEAGIREVFSYDLKPIMLNEQGELKYHNGIHLCVDNSANNGKYEDEYLRLVYPTKENMPATAPAFLVIGGATLSRGLTLEGLISTFFLRSVKQADTLMQMGRWFGYRRGYELIPRLWITGNARLQFDYLSSLDQELRDEIHMMDVMGLKPSEYAARVKNTPRLQLIRITAKNRMQSAVDAEMDFSGSFNQTYLFDDDAATLEHNLDITGRFIEGLGEPEQRKACNTHSSNANIWRGVSFDKVEEFLNGFSFCNRLSVFNDMTAMLSWIKQITREGNLDDWNIVLAGKKNAAPEEMWNLANCSVSKVSRTRKSTKNDIPGVINIGVLRAPSDILADVDLDGQPQAVIDMFSHIEEKKVKEIRSLAGLERTPQILIYIVDKDSKPKAGSVSRKDLDAPCDIAGICINIPGGATGANYVAKVCVNLDNEFSDEGDLDGSNN